jgi:ricin-type beta-trefoil lectin protein
MARRLILALAGLIVAFSLAAPTATAAGPDRSNQPKLPEGVSLRTFPGNPSQIGPQAGFLANLDAYVYLRNARTGKCMGVAGANPNNGAAIMQWECVRRPGSDQRMRLYEPREGSGWYHIDPSFSAGKCAGVGGSSTAPGAALMQWSCSSTETDQLFAIRLTKILPGNVWRVEFWTGHTYGDTNQLVGVAGGSTANGARVVQWPFAGNSTDCAGDQCWDILWD